jgi:hypothetical protein
MLIAAEIGIAVWIQLINVLGARHMLSLAPFSALRSQNVADCRGSFAHDPLREI